MTAMLASQNVCKIELPDDDVGNEVPGSTRLVDKVYNFNEESDQIGEGTYGKVFVGYDKATNQKVALKMIRLDSEREGFPITAIREIKLLSGLKHENIVNLREIVRSKIGRSNNFKGNVYMVFDYAEYDLAGLMDKIGYKLTPAQVKCILSQLLKGLAYCHLNGVLHRDLKASNLLINKTGVVKLADFGLARKYVNNSDAKYTNRVITLWYRPPELLMGSERYGPEVDMWSVGCIFAELLARRPLFPGRNEPEQLEMIFKCLGAPTADNWPEAAELEFYKNLDFSRLPKGNAAFHEWCDKNGITDQPAKALLLKLLALNPAERIDAPTALLDEYFFCSPKACEPGQLPKVTDAHEWTMKRSREARGQVPYGHHQAGAAGAGAGRGGGRGAAHAAGAGGPERNARGRGGGGVPYGVPGNHSAGPGGPGRGYSGGGRGYAGGAPAAGGGNQPPPVPGYNGGGAGGQGLGSGGQQRAPLRQGGGAPRGGAQR